jgi:transcriptional regulator with XRE-family HTH domain
VITGNIGKRLKAARVDRGLTLKAVEAACGVSATHISEIERGAASPTVGALEKIARALGRRAGYFLEADEIGEFSLVTRDDRVRETAASGGVVERLTTYRWYFNACINIINNYAGNWGIINKAH